MKEIRILHLMPKLLSLYGEYGNVSILRNVLADHGYHVSVEEWETGNLDLNGYDLIYIGSGTEDNLKEAVRRLTPYADQIRESVDADRRWLATGNAMSIFSSSALNTLPFDCVTDPEKRFMGDVITEDAFGGPLVGYVNTSCKFEGITAPLFSLRFGGHLGNDKGSTNAEGIRYREFLGTQLIGPVLVKNPHFLEELAGRIAGCKITVSNDSYLKKAYAVTLSELEKRAK